MQTFNSAFSNAVIRVFDTMVGLKVAAKKPSAPRAPEISGIIGISGDLVGSVHLAFDAASAKTVAGHFTGAGPDISDEELTDAIGELTNMVAGSGKASIQGKALSISLPTVIFGRDHHVETSKDTLVFEEVFVFEGGSFLLDVRLSQSRRK